MSVVVPSALLWRWITSLMMNEAEPPGISIGELTVTSAGTWSTDRPVTQPALHSDHTVDRSVVHVKGLMYAVQFEIPGHICGPPESYLTERSGALGAYLFEAQIVQRHADQYVARRSRAAHLWSLANRSEAKGS